MRLFVISLFAAILVSQPVEAEETLQPIGKWTVDFGDKRCTAYRAFGSKSSPIILTLKPSPIGEVLQLQLMEKGHGSRPTQDRIHLTLSNGESIDLLQLRYGGQGQEIRQVNLAKSDAARLAGTTTLRWHRPQQLDYQLPLGPMTNLMKVIEECRGTLADYWNATAEKQAMLQRPPILTVPLISLFSTDDYPRHAVWDGQSGITRVVVLVDEKGEIADCSLIETSGIAVLDAQTCIILRKRGRFYPAAGADGKPTRSVFTQGVRWEMPK